MAWRTFRCAPAGSAVPAGACPAHAACNTTPRRPQGLLALPLLRELYASFNDISELAPLAGCEVLQVLDLESNQIGDLDAVGYLGMVQGLTTLTLEGAAQPAGRMHTSQDLPTSFL